MQAMPPVRPPNFLLGHISSMCFAVISSTVVISMEEVCRRARQGGRFSPLLYQADHASHMRKPTLKLQSGIYAGNAIWMYRRNN